MRAFTLDRFDSPPAFRDDLAEPTPRRIGVARGWAARVPVGAAGEGPERFNVMGVSSVENIRRLAELLDAGTIRVPIQRSYPLERAGEAIESQQAEHTQGKVGVTVM